jgi:hypothetical protein
LEKNLSSCQYLIILLMYVESQVCLAWKYNWALEMCWINRNIPELVSIFIWVASMFVITVF